VWIIRESTNKGEMTMSQQIAPKFRTCILLAFFAGFLFQGHVHALTDTESATHIDTAATQVIVENYEYPETKIVQFNLAVLSHYSYMVVSNKNALVVDPDRDIQVYQNTAKKEGWTIKGVFLTHSHADFVAGHSELVQAVACPIYQSKDSGAAYKTSALSDGQVLPWGTAKLQFLSTPGHTPDGMCMLIFSKDDGTTPKAILTGDTLFIGSVGRPDLMGGAMAAATLAGMSYDTWTNKLSKLNDNVLVLPAHGAGSLCGAHLRDTPSSTIGIERQTNPYLQHKSKNDFITAVLEGLPQAPQYFKHNAKMNREGPPLVNWDAAQPEIPVLTTSLTDTQKYFIVDLRDAKDFAAGHIPNSINIGLRGRLESWVGILVPWDSNLILCGTPEETKEAVFRLNRIGYSVLGTIPFDAWAKAKLPIFQNDSILPQELHRRMQNGTAPLIVDVRLPTEWMGLSIGNVVNMPLDQLSDLAVKLDPNQPVTTICNSAYRSSMGIGILERRAFKNVASMTGGIEAWIDTGLPVLQPTAPGIAAAIPKRVIKLPDLIDSTQLKRMLMDRPGTFDIVDIRSAEHFKDFNLPGSLNVNIADLIADTTYQIGAGPLVIVDRNGTLAIAAGGILSQKTDRQIKVLFGGLEAYWGAIEMGTPIKAVPFSQDTAKPISPVVPKAITPTTPQQPQAPKKKSAGC